ncbi:MAG: hypothetical protein JOZ58_10475 [Acetobacteraceae bacterium]|nr:hypothetical protein [Acetobacteraceae bacterium]
MVSPFTTGGHVSHEYSDHVSILKFIEATGDCRRSPAAAATTSPIRCSPAPTRMSRPTSQRSAT